MKARAGLTIATVPPGTISYRDSTVQVMEQSYHYRLQARDSCGYTSPYSNVGTSIFAADHYSGF